MDFSYCGKCGGRVENGVCTQCGAQMQEQPANNAQPQYAGAQPEYGAAQPQYGAAQPQYGAAQPQYGAAQPQYGAAQPQYGAAQPQYGAAQPQYGYQANSGLVEPDEQVIATIGNSYAENFFTSGFLGMGGAMLTNKRFYYTGKAVSVSSALLQKTKCIVELSEVTGVEIVHKDKLGLSIFMAVLWQALAIVGFASNANMTWLGVIFEFFVVLAVIIGVLSIKNMLCVVFKGGCVTFPIKLYGFAQCNEFLRQTLLARKAYIEQNK